MSDIADDLREVMKGVDAGEQTTIEKDSGGEPLVREVAEDKPPAKDDGRFAPKTAAENKVPENQEPKSEVEEGQQGEQTEVTSPAPAPTAVRAPVSWKPEVREEWSKLPPSVQAEVTRRETEIQAALRHSAQTRQFYQQFEQTIAPYQQILQAENAHPLVAMGELFKTAALLRTAPAPQRANLVADMIAQFGVDVGLLDEALSKRQTQQPGGFDPSILDQKLAPVMEFINQARQQPEQHLRQEAERTWFEFASKPENEFAEDLREDIADLLELSAKRGQHLSLQEAYRRATLAHPTIAGLITRRQQQAGAAQQTAAARRAKEAAASISSTTAPSRADEGEDDGSIRSAIRASVKQLSASR